MSPKKQIIHKSLKIAVWDKHIGEHIGKTKCTCCEITDITQMKFHCGHIIAEAKGGDTNISNLMPICESCNKSMGTNNLFEFKKMIVDMKDTKAKEKTKDNTKDTKETKAKDNTKETKAKDNTKEKTKEKTKNTNTKENTKDNAKDNAKDNTKEKNQDTKDEAKKAKDEAKKAKEIEEIQQKKDLELLLSLAKEAKKAQEEKENKIIQQRQSLEILLEKAKNCNYQYYFFSTDCPPGIMNMFLKCTDGDVKPYKLISDTYDFFFSAEKIYTYTPYGKNHNKTIYTHKYCDVKISVDTTQKVIEIQDKIKLLYEHKSCLLKDDDYLNFAIDKKYIS